MFVLPLAWCASALVALVGFVAPRLLYGEGARGPGPLFWPLATLSTVGTLAVKGWLFSLARAAQGRERTRRFSILLANVAGALGGGGLIGLHVLGFDVAFIAAPLLSVSVATVALATWSSETPQGRAALFQGGVQSLVVAALRALRLWRTVRGTARRATESITKVVEAAAGAEQRASTLTEKSDRLGAAVAHLQESLSDLAVIRSAVASKLNIVVAGQDEA